MKEKDIDVLENAIEVLQKYIFDTADEEMVELAEEAKVKLKIILNEGCSF